MTTPACPKCGKGPTGSMHWTEYGAVKSEYRFPCHEIEVMISMPLALALEERGEPVRSAGPDGLGTAVGESGESGSSS